MKLEREHRAGLGACLLGALGALTLGACGDGGGNGGAGETDAAVETCFSGSEGCPCTVENTCDPGLACVSGGCVDLLGSGACGNGNLDVSEECDLGVFNADDGACKSDCTLQRCGDGIVGASEACDDGNDVDTDDCTNSCAFATCGDGIVQAIEECDDGNFEQGDACLNTCLSARCGDGIVQQDVEACDDGNAVDGDGCETDCTTTVVTTCGNGTDDPGELCFAQNDILAGKRPTRPTLIDLDDDGVLDIVAANTDAGDVWIWRGTGGGAFAAPVEIAVGSLPVDVAVVDFDGDDELDIVTANAGDDALRIGFGTGTFGIFDFVDVPLGATPVAAAAYNLASDATQDVIVAVQGATDTEVRVVRGTGAQTLPFPTVATNPAALLGEGTASAFASGNVVGGSNRYILASDTVRSRVRGLFVETANNIIQSPDAAFSLPIAIQPHGLDVGDVNGDGADDVVTANWNPQACNYAKSPAACAYDTVSVIFGDPSASPALFLGKQDYAVGKAPWDPVVADFDGDGDLDIGTANGYSGTITVLDNDGGGAFETSRTFRFGPSAETVFAVGEDLNGDGRADLIIARRAMNTLSVLLSNP